MPPFCKQNLLLVDLQNFATATLRYTVNPQLVRGRFVYDTYRTMETTRSLHG